MKTLSQKLSYICLLCALLIGGGIVSHAATSATNESNSKTVSSPKISFSRERNKLSVEKSKSASKRGFWECFGGCLARNADPETVAGCVNDCANGNIPSCAACVGVSIIVAGTCAYSCRQVEQLEEGNQAKNIKQKHYKNGLQKAHS